MSSALITKRLPSGRRELLQTFCRITKLHGEICVPAGFVTDYSSIPVMFSWVVDWSRVDCAGVIHDHLYRTKVLSRKAADDIWREIALSGDHAANDLQSRVCWLALRVFGWVAWRRN